MIRSTVLIAAVVLLAGCLRLGDGVERLSETEIDPSSLPKVDAVAAPQEGTSVVAELLQAAGGGAPAEDEPVLDAVAPEAGSEGATPGPRGLARLLPFGRRAAVAQPTPVAAILPQTDVEVAAPDVAQSEAPSDAAPIAEEAVATADVDTPEAAPERRGLFARLRGGGAAEPVPPAENQADVIQVAAVVAPSLADATEPADEEAKATPEATPVAARRTTLLGALRRGGGPATPPTPGPGQDGIGFGETLPYGSLATICGVTPALMGEQVARYPDRSPVYRIYDSQPGSLALRTHYITGFKDGCARQFTAALAIFGAPSGHEATRYERSHRHIDMTRTDREYEALRARTCQAPVGRTCPPRRFSRFEKSTVFVSVYERFGTNPRWADVLIHDGRVVAKDLKGD